MRNTGARVVVAAVALLALAACASRLQGEVSYDGQADFSRYRSFALAPGESAAPAARAIAEREVKRALEAKGLRAVDRASADLVAHVQLDRRRKTRLSGSIDLEPMQKLSAVLALTDLVYTVERERVVISAR